MGFGWGALVWGLGIHGFWVGWFRALGFRLPVCGM